MGVETYVDVAFYVPNQGEVPVVVANIGVDRERASCVTGNSVGIACGYGKLGGR